VAKPKKTADFTKGFAPDDLPRITDYLTGPVHSLRPHPVPSVPHGTAPHAHETAPHTRGTPHGESQSTVTPRAPVPMSSTASVAHTAAHDAPAATHSLKQGPKAFLEGATVLMRTSDGMKARTPGLTMDYEKFIKWMDGKDRHWFTLTPHVDSARAGREVYLLTPAVEKYAHEFADDPALRYLLDGHNLPGLRGQDEYLAAHYVPYFPGKPTRPDAEIGHADIPMERGDGFSPDFVFTAAMNGCAFTVTRGEAEGSFRAWHFQSPTTNRDESQLFRLDRRPTDWFGDGEYQSPLDQSVTPETTNIMWRGEDGWHFVSQENHTTRENVNDVWTKQVSSRPVHFDGSRRLDYVLRFYTRTTEDRLLKLRWYHQDYTSRLDSSPSSLHLKGAWTLHAEQARRDVEALGGVRSLEDLKETLTKLEADQKATRGLMQYYFKEQEKAFGDERDTLLRQQASSWWPGAMAAAVRKLDEMERLQGQVRFWIDDLSDPKWLLGLQKEAAGLTEPAPEPRAVSAPAPAGDPAQSTPHPMGAQGAPAHSTHWQAVRAKTPHVTRSHRWVNPISRPLGGAGHNVPRYVVASKFDARRFDVSGQRYTDLTVKVHMDGTGQVTAGQLDAVWGRAQAGVDRLFNSPGHTLPDGSVLHVTLERAESGTAAHLKATVGPHGTPSSQDMWAVDADDQVLAHELGHQLGLRDEYREATPERDEDQGTTSKHRPEITGSLMGDFTRAPKDDLPRGGMRDRYLHLLNAIIGDLDTATPTSAAAQTPRASGGTYGGVAPRAPQNGAATTGEIPETPLTPVHQPPELDGYINPAAGSPALTAGAADQSAAPAFSAAGADTHPVADVEPGAGGPRTVAEDQIFRVLSAGTGPDRDTPVGPAGDASSERSSGALPEDGDDGPGSPGHAPIPQLDDARQ
jgi:hypothetical protein